MRSSNAKPIRLERPLFGQCARQIAPLAADELGAALEEQQRGGGRLGQILYDMGLLTQEQVLETLSLQAKMVAFAARGDLKKGSLPYDCKLSVCLPAFNEADNIESTLESAATILPEFVREFELVIANDGSTDDTADVVRQFAERTGVDVRLIDHPQNRGYGAAVTTASKAAVGDLVMFMDSDGQFSLLDLPPFLALLDSHDMVVGYRHDRADNLMRKTNAKAWTKLVQYVLKTPCRDLDCAFKLFRREDLHSLEMTSEGAGINAEIMAQCVTRGMSIAQTPVSHYPCYFGEQTGANLKVITRAFRELGRLRKARKAALRGAQGAAWSTDRAPAKTMSSTEAEGKLSVCLLAACPFPANHGTAGSIREMAEAVSDRGHDVHIVTYHFGEDIPVVGPTMHRTWKWTRGSKVVIGPTVGRMFSDVLLVFKALQVIWREKPDVIHAHGYEAGIAAGICRFLTRVPVVYSGHNTMEDELASFDFIRPKWFANWFARLLDRTVPRFGDRCIPHSESLEKFFEESGLARRTEPVIRFGIDLAWADKQQKDKQTIEAYIRAKHGLKGRVILYTGVLDQFQRIDLLLDAMVKVRQVCPDVQLLIAQTIPAEKNLERVKQQAAERDLSDAIVFTEPLDLDGVRECLTACDLTVIPRPGAPGFPIKLLNYMSAAKPCVMFASSACGLVNRKHALLVDEDTGEALAEGLLELLSSEGLCMTLGSQAYRFLLEHHDRRLTAKELSDAYRRTLLQTGRALPTEPTQPRDRWEDAVSDSLVQADVETVVDLVPPPEALAKPAASANDATENTNTIGQIDR